MTLLSDAAANIGAPEELVKRSADARSEASGASVDDILTAWAGGAAAPSDSTPAPSPEAAPQATAPPTTTEAPAPSALQESPDVAPTRVITLRDPEAAPVLVGRRESPKAMILTVSALLAFGVLVGALLPAIAASQEATNHVVAQPLYSADAETGREIYLAEGCSTCHTMSVRSLEVDAGLGFVTEPEDIANFFESVEGVRRIGPDLAHIGERMEAADIKAFVSNPTFVNPDAHHPPYKYLSSDEIDNLTTFLSETK